MSRSSLASQAKHRWDAAHGDGGAARVATRSSSLPDALAAPRRSFETSSGQRLAYYAADERGDQRPLVLIHSINAAPSSFEMRPLFNRYRGRRPVYSLDLPGFGHSQRGPGPYSAEGYATALVEFLGNVVGRPADLVVLSLSAEFAARAALLAPARCASLVFISPTGFSSQSLPSLGVARLLRRVLNLPGLAQLLFALVSSKPSIRYYLGRSFVGRVPPEILAYAHATAHQPGARHAPLTFLSSLLFTRDAMTQLYAKLSYLPVMVIADQDPYIDFVHLAAFCEHHPNWHHVSLGPHLGLPHWERLAETTEVIDRFWDLYPDRAA